MAYYSKRRRTSKQSKRKNKTTNRRRTGKLSKRKITNQRRQYGGEFNTEDTKFLIDSFKKLEFTPKQIDNMMKDLHQNSPYYYLLKGRLRDILFRKINNTIGDRDNDMDTNTLEKKRKLIIQVIKVMKEGTQHLDDETESEDSDEE